MATVEWSGWRIGLDEFGSQLSVATAIPLKKLAGTDTDIAAQVAGLILKIQHGWCCRTNYRWW
ncbi:MAG: hypothetical protein U0T81_00815 [Saprospiraceae bacterium]